MDHLQLTTYVWMCVNSDTMIAPPKTHRCYLYMVPLRNLGFYAWFIILKERDRKGVKGENRGTAFTSPSSFSSTSSSTSHGSLLRRAVECCRSLFLWLSLPHTANEPGEEAFSVLQPDRWFNPVTFPPQNSEKTQKDQVSWLELLCFMLIHILFLEC